MTSSSNTKNQLEPLRLIDSGVSRTPTRSPLTTDDVYGSDGSEPGLECTKRKQENEDQPLNVLVAPAGSAADANENEELVITRIRATGVVLCLGRIPVGFYAMVQYGGLEWRTDVKSLPADDDDVEWDMLMPVPSDLSATVCLGVFATFELQPMLGNGEQLRKLSIPIGQLLARGAQDLQFAFFQEDEDVTSPCTSILVTVRRRKREDSDSSTSGDFTPHCLITKLSELEEATDQGHKAFSQYRDYGELQDLERSIKQFERALDLCPLDHPGRAAAQSNVAEAKFMYCLLDDNELSLDIPLALYRDALAARLGNHPDRPFTLIQLAATYFARFEQRRDGVDALQAEALLHEVMDLSSVESQQNQTAATMLRLYATRRTDPLQADDQLSIEQDSASNTADVDPWTLSDQLLYRYGRSADLADLQQAISVLDISLRSISIRSDRYFPGLASLSMAFLDRFIHLGDLSDLEKAVSGLVDVVDLAPNGDPDKPIYLNNLGKAFKVRFERHGEQNDLEQAISRFEDALDLTPDNHSDKCNRLSNLGNCFKARFRRFGELSDLEQAISKQRDAVVLAPRGHPNRRTCLDGIGSALLIRFDRLGELGDLEEAVSSLRDADGLTPEDHADKPNVLNNLANSLFARFQRLGEHGDLEEAISKQLDAVKLSRDHTDKPIYLDHLGTFLVTRFSHLGELGDLEQAILSQEDAVNLTPNDHPGKSSCLSNLGHSFLIRFERFGTLSDLEQAILRFMDAVDITPNGRPEKPVRLNNLGDAFLARFERLGDLNDLEQALSRQEVAVSLAPDGHTYKPIYLNSLGNSFFDRFERLGELSDLEQTISRYKNAIDLMPDSHPDKPGCLNNLGNSLTTRFERLGELADLEQAISMFRDAIDLTLRRDSQPNKVTYLNNISTSFHIRFERLGQLSDLEQAISRSRDSVNTIPNDHPHQPTCLNNLGNYLLDRFECLGEESDLEQAILRLEDAVSLTPDDSLYKAPRLDNLGRSFLARFKHFGELHDFELAISKQKEAVDLTPDGHPNKPRYLSRLGDSFRIRYERLDEPSNLGEALSLYSRAACAFVGPISDRFHASQKWISCARTLRHYTLLDATAVNLLPQLAWVGLSLAHRYRELLKGADVVREAAAASLGSGQPEIAVEWLEQGRSIVWGELFQLRSSYNELSSVYPDHARKLRELSVALEHAGATRERSLSSPSEGTRGADRCDTASLEQVIDRHRTLAIARDKLLQEVRELRGFERFLLHKEFSQFRAAARSGPVVMLNAAESRCDALIILADVEHVIHVPLPGYTLERSKALQNKVKNLLGPARAIPQGDRYGRPAAQEAANEWSFVLAPLWKCIVKPVLDALGFVTPGTLSRIFWCPTGPFTFLPIHAAGYYDPRHAQPGHKIFDFVVSSYVPTLSILSSSPPPDAAPKNKLYLLAVRQPPSDGLSRLPGVDAELEHIRSVLGNPPCARATLVESPLGTVEEVLALMKDADWVHFACHGIQDATNPTRSGLCLADRRRLQLSDIIALSRPRGGLAFLSACQTAKGDEDLSDEAIHIAAGMLFAGYGGIVGTMWSISDRLAPRVARDVYERLFSGNGCPDYREAAWALQDAVGRLRCQSDVSFVDWLPFIHVGL